MINKISIRLRLSILSMLLLTICCIGLTLVLSISASKMVDVIESIPLQPAIDSNYHNNYNYFDNYFDSSKPMLIEPAATSQAARKEFKYKSLAYMWQSLKTS